MRHFRSATIFILALMMLILSSCTGISIEPTPDRSKNTSTVGNSLYDNFGTTPETSDGDTTTQEKSDFTLPGTDQNKDPNTVPNTDNKTTTEPDTDNQTTTAPNTDNVSTTKPDTDDGSTTLPPDTEDHVHIFFGATCTEAGKCECGAEDAPLGHDFSEATCTSPATCERCGITEGKALEHDYAAATCTSPATCKSCGKTSGKKLGHDLTAATCTSPATCTRCKTTSGKALGHNYTGTTCTDEGTCTRCGDKNKALGHNFAAATCTAPKTCKRCGLTEGSALGHNYSGGKCKKCGDTNGPLSPEDAKLFKNKLTDEENAEALAIAREFARQIMEAYPDDSDYIYRIAMAAEMVSNEYYKGVHVESGIYYSQAYGVFVKRESSCAGCTRALGLVLTCMGYEWEHVNEGLWDHQWVTLTINGEEIWADGQVGWVGYGKHPLA